METTRGREYDDRITIGPYDRHGGVSDSNHVSDFAPGPDPRNELVDVSKDLWENRNKQPPQPAEAPKKVSPAVSLLSVAPKESEYLQMQEALLLQLEKCKYYRDQFEKSDNTTMANKFETLLKLTQHDLEIVKTTWDESSRLPRWAFEIVHMTCLPANVDVKEKEMFVSVKLCGVPVADGSTVYAIAEFEYPTDGREQTVSQSIGRWSQRIKIEPKKFFNACFKDDSRQLEMLYSAEIKPYLHDSIIGNTKKVRFDRAARFYIEKGKSRTLKRKYKPVKITFFEKTNILQRDKELGFVHIRIDGINDHATIVQQLHLTVGRKQTLASVEVKVRVHQPFVDKSIRCHQEKIVVLT